MYKRYVVSRLKLPLKYPGLEQYRVKLNEVTNKKENSICDIVIGIFKKLNGYKWCSKSYYAWLVIKVI